MKVSEQPAGVLYQESSKQFSDNQSGNQNAAISSQNEVAAMPASPEIATNFNLEANYRAFILRQQVSDPQTEFEQTTVSEFSQQAETGNLLDQQTPPNASDTYTAGEIIEIIRENPDYAGTGILAALVVDPDLSVNEQGNLVHANNPALGPAIEMLLKMAMNHQSPAEIKTALEKLTNIFNNSSAMFSPSLDPLQILDNASFVANYFDRLDPGTLSLFADRPLLYEMEFFAQDTAFANQDTIAADGYSLVPRSFDNQFGLPAAGTQMSYAHLVEGIQNGTIDGQAILQGMVNSADHMSHLHEGQWFEHLLVGDVAARVRRLGGIAEEAFNADLQAYQAAQTPEERAFVLLQSMMKYGNFEKMLDVHAQYVLADGANFMNNYYQNLQLAANAVQDMATAVGAVAGGPVLAAGMSTAVEGVFSMALQQGQTGTIDYDQVMREMAGGVIEGAAVGFAGQLSSRISGYIGGFLNGTGLPRAVSVAIGNSFSAVTSNALMIGGQTASEWIANPATVPQTQEQWDELTRNVIVASAAGVLDVPIGEFFGRMAGMRSGMGHYVTSLVQPVTSEVTQEYIQQVANNLAAGQTLEQALQNAITSTNVGQILPLALGMAMLGSAHSPQQEAASRTYAADFINGFVSSAQLTGRLTPAQAQVVTQLMNAKLENATYIDLSGIAPTGSTAAYTITNTQNATATYWFGGSAPAQMYTVEIEGRNYQIYIPQQPAPNSPSLSQIVDSLAALPAAQRELINEVKVSTVPRPDAPSTWADAHPNGNVITFYPSTDWQSKNFLNATMQHEAGHFISWDAFGYFDPNNLSDGWENWQSAIAADGFDASHYGNENLEEDFSEALTLYMNFAGTPLEPEIRALMPERFAILDGIFNP